MPDSVGITTGPGVPEGGMTVVIYPLRARRRWWGVRRRLRGLGGLSLLRSLGESPAARARR
jgi:hypothetical protein